MPSIADLMSRENQERLAARLRELAEVDRITRERGQQQPAPVPLPIFRPPTEEETTQ